MPLTLALLAVLLPARLLWEPYSIPSGSMKPTLLAMDHVLVRRGPYDPARSDVVVFDHPVTGVEFVMRVVGLPGETVQMRAGRLHIDGEPVALEPAGDFVEPYAPQGPSGSFPVCRDGPPAQGRPCAVARLTETLPGAAPHAVLDLGATPQDDTGAFTVPAGHLFVMGDHRDDSADSRFPQASGGVGFVPLEDVRGPVDLVVISSAGPTFDPASWRPDRILLAIE